MNSQIEKTHEDLFLLPYQSAFAANTARFKIGLWARQTGKDHTATAEAVLDCLHHPGTTWIILAAGERQAIESLAKAKEWADILKFKIEDYIETPANVPLAIARGTSNEIKWSNGSRLLALPANPQTVRGYSANVILTEFAFHENPDEIWRAIYPSISNPLRGGEKKLRIISTPNGLNNRFAQLWNNASSYHRSKITIHDAIAAGLPLDAAELKEGLNDDDAWAQEYLCEFMDTSSVLLPYDLIATCESQDATEYNTPQDLSRTRGQLFAGIDFGRKHHLTVCWILERVGRVSAPGALPHSSISTNLHSSILQTREVLVLPKMSTPDQVAALVPRLARCHKVCLDYTGAGIGLGDYLVKQFPGFAPFQVRVGPPPTGKIELCQFTAPFKAELFPRLRAAFEQRQLRIPVSREIREDLHAVQRTVTQTGQITYRAPHTPDGHSDRSTALALALRAAAAAPISAGATWFHVPGRTANLRWARRRRISSARASHRWI